MALSSTVEARPHQRSHLSLPVFDVVTHQRKQIAPKCRCCHRYYTNCRHQRSAVEAKSNFACVVYWFECWRLTVRASNQTYLTLDRSHHHALLMSVSFSVAQLDDDVRMLSRLVSGRSRHHQHWSWVLTFAHVDYFWWVRKYQRNFRVGQDWCFDLVIWPYSFFWRQILNRFPMSCQFDHNSYLVAAWVSNL